MIRQSNLIVVVGAFLMGCTVLLVVGCAGVRSEAPQKEEQVHTEATASEEARCEGTRTFKSTKWAYLYGTGPPSNIVVTTNDIAGCPNGGLLSGTDKADKLDGLKGEDEIHGLGANDDIKGGLGNDAIYGGPGHDTSLAGEDGDDVLYGGMATTPMCPETMARTSSMAGMATMPLMVWTRG